ncbi:MAG TPA: ABC transporter permease [Blastocatellia bacterium]|nr:ABC transporter permease [Blastocatellia bacterium]
MNTLWQDVRYGLRLIRRNPGFTLVAALSLALGIGANTAIFTVVNAVLLRPLPFPEPEQLVMVWEDATFAGFPQNTPAPANFVDWQAQSRSFESMAALSEGSFNLTGDGEPEKIQAYRVTANFFPLLGVQPALGRSFLAAEDQPGANRVVMLSHGLWQRRFGGEPSVIGKDILLNGEKYRVIGVMPRGFQFLERYIGLWTPLALTAEERTERGSHYLKVVGRLKPGVTVAQANADIGAVMEQIARTYPNQAARIGAYVLPLREQLAGDIRRPLMVLLVAVGCVLLIACANIASLLLARAAARNREIAVRAALGAGRWRIVRQLLTESILLSGIGGALGLLFAVWSFAFLEQLIPPTMALTVSLEPDGRMLVFTLLISMLTGILFGLVPALQAARFNQNEALKQGSGRAVNLGSRRLRSALVVAEIALSLVLLVGAGLLIQTFHKLRQQYAGLRPENVLTMRTPLPQNKYAQPEQRTAFYDQVRARVGALPGVISVGYTTSVPLEWKGGTSGFVPENTQQPLPGLSYDANHRQVSADYLKTMGIPLRRGRYFDSRDQANSLPVAIINETMAREYWPNEDALGKRFKIGDPDSDVPWLTVVGIVADVRQMGLDAPVKAEMYQPYQQAKQQPWYAPRDLVIRTAVEPESLVAAVRREIRAIDPDQPISNIRTMDEILGEETQPRRLGMTLLAVFAGLALVLAALGIYGVLSYFVVQHTPEMGVRMALGAGRRDILALVVRKGLSLALLGIGAGVIASLGLTRLMQSLLFEVSANDPLTLAGVALLLLAVALVACLVPARRAAKVDPIVALRCE